MNGITRETFREIQDINAKLDVLFDIITDPNRECESLKAIEKKCERKEKIDSGIAAFFGFVGGALAVLGQKIFLGKP